ncbi:hypothetical protein AXG93_3954s1130 [Marchantia polymorpha subsp. ruderalis]|uniref:Uncharacterized protein n=1 Tax=Marchantia polymorpha subsp. ruderalis TaxID=1480154 RepID=A0A176VLX5_MARPO|nr:hypothetical protein AXG93_3954s1130 [Marchantia polymorpha subsp. ruderalis]
MVKDLTLYEEIFEQVLAQVGGTVINIPEIPLPPPKKEVKLEAEKKEREDHLRAKEMECKVLHLNLAKETEMRALLEQDCISLRGANANVKKMTEELCERLEASKVAYAAEVQRIEELTVASAKCDQLHVAELAKEEERRAEE